jgi:hypothetical protein
VKYFTNFLAERRLEVLTCSRKWNAGSFLIASDVADRRAAENFLEKND